MAWDFRIGFRLNLFHVLILKVLLAQLCVLGIFSNNFVQATDLCDNVHHCTCYREIEYYDIQCPNKFLSVYPISAKVHMYGNEAHLELICDYEKPDFEWRLIRGLDFSTVQDAFNVTQLSINYCPIPSQNDSMADLLKHLSLEAEKIKYFKFVSHRDLRTLPDYMLSPLVNLTEINLSQNGLTTMPNISFFPKLKYLEFHTNGIIRFSQDTFSSNQLLQVIIVRNNNLTEIADRSLPESLESLDLQSNRISTVTNGTFSNLDRLKKLYLNQNPLEDMDPYAFSSLSQLRVLRLDSNSFKKFPVLSNLPSLEDISMSHNRYYLSLSKLTSPLTRPSTTAVADVTTVPPTTGAEQLNALMTTTVMTNGVGGDETNRTTRASSETETLSDSNGNNARSSSEVTDSPTTIDPVTTLVPTTAPQEDAYQGSINNLPSLSNLTLSNDGLTALPLLQNLPNLTNLILNRNKIQTVPTSAFARVPSLRSLDLSRNEISNVGDIQAKNLIELDLSRNNIDTLGRSTFVYLVNLQKLSLAKNMIKFIDPKAFEALKNLKEVDLSGNMIDLANPSGPQFEPTFILGYSPLRFCTNLEIINLSHNQISSVASDFYTNLLKLTSLDLSHNKFTVIRAVDLNFIQDVISVDLSFNKIHLVDMSFYDVFLDFDIRKKVVISLDGNPLECDCALLAFKSYNLKPLEFRTDNLRCVGPIRPKNLTGMLFQYVPKDDLFCPFLESDGCPESCECWRRPSDLTLIIDCGGKLKTATVKLPKLDLNLSSKPNDKKYELVLNLSDNGIRNIPEDYAAALPSRLRAVDLRRNELKSLSFLKVLGDNNMTRFNLSDNPFPCFDCAFHSDARSQFRRIWDSDNLTCRLEDGYQTQKALEFNFENICSAKGVLAIVVPIVVLAVLFIISAIVYVRNGWAIRAYMYSKGFGFFLCDSYLEDDEEKLYDAFVSYSHRDEAWVLEELVKRLEEQEGFKLCLHFRDWTPGDWIPDQIVRSVDQSRRTVVVLSKSFVESVWSRLEFKAAHSQALSERSNRLILVLMGEDLTDKDVQDDDLRVYMKMNTYIKWNDPWFWHKLKYALPHRKCIVEENRNHCVKRAQRERAIQLDKIRTKMENQIPV